MPNIKLVVEATLNDAAIGEFEIDAKTIFGVPMGGSITIDLSEIKKSMDEMADKLEENDRRAYHK